MRGYFKDGVARDMAFTEVLMVDEIHVGTKDNSVIIDLWIEARRQGVRVPKLLLATATDYGLAPLMKQLGGAVFRSDFRHFKVRQVPIWGVA